MKYIFLAIVLHLSGSQDLPPTEGEESAKQQVEFIEKNENQPYIEYLNFEQLNYLDLLRLRDSLEGNKLDLSADTGHLCPQDVLKSLGLKGFPNPITKERSVNQCD